MSLYKYLCLCLQFGVEVRLSQFTLTKLVIVTPYFLLVNETEVYTALSIYIFIPCDHHCMHHICSST